MGCALLLTHMVLVDMWHVSEPDRMDWAQLCILACV
jgi:hypothetical protein